MKPAESATVVSPYPPSRTRGLKPRWQPGQSGNPSGRPVNPLKPKLLKLLRGPEGEKLIRAFWDRAVGEATAPSVDTQAARLLLEYSIGKAPAAQEDRDALASGGGVTVVFLPDKPSRDKWDAQVERYLSERKQLEPTVTVEAETVE